MKLWIGMVALLALSACAADRRGGNSLGTWRSADLYSVELKAGGMYNFCDGDVCVGGHFSRPGASDSVAIELDGLLATPQAQRLKARLMAVDAENATVGGALDFTVAAGVALDEVCSGRPCVFYGSISDREKRLVFFREP